MLLNDQPDPQWDELLAAGFRAYNAGLPLYASQLHLPAMAVHEQEAMRRLARTIVNEARARGMVP